MKIAVPTADGVLCPHFGHCQQFAILDVDQETKTINNVEMMPPPPHEPGVFPKWLSEMGCTIIIAGGMGGRAISLFQESGVEVVMGAPSGKPEDIVMNYLTNDLSTGANPCDDPGFHGDSPCGE